MKIKKLLEIYPRRNVAMWALLFFAIVWLTILGFSGSVFSGYHLTDDHEIVRIKKDLESKEVMSVAVKWMKDDQLVTHRFRPFYYFHRVLGVELLGSNFIAWSIYNALLAIATSFLLFYFLCLLGFYFWESLLFSLITLNGPQATIWWRLGPQESLGMFLLSASLFFLALYVLAKKNQGIFRIIFIIFAVLTALSKESFLLMLPALALLSIYLSKIKGGLSWKESAKKNIVSAAVLMVIFFGLILYIKKFIGTQGIGYAGISGFDWKAYSETFWNISTNWFGYLILAQIILILISVLLGTNRWENVRKILKKYAPPVIIFLSIVVPQVILHAKSGFLKRYMVPALLGYAMAFIFLSRQMKGRLIYAKAGIILTAMLFILVDVAFSFRNAQDFSKEGRNVNNLFRTIKERTFSDENILIVGDPVEHHEWIGSIAFYLKNEAKRDNLYIYPLARKPRPTDDDFSSVYGKKLYNNVPDKEIFSAIMLFPRTEKKFLENFPNKTQLEESFVREEFGDYLMYYND